MRRPFCLLLAAALAGPGGAAAQARAPGLATSADIEPPVIELEALGQAAAAGSQVFTAQVVDDRGLRDVLLYHRRAGRQPFTPVAMTAVGDTAFHSVTLETDPADLRAIEYYVQARDLGGNRAVAGFAFDPFVRRLEAAPRAPSSGALALGAVPVTRVPAGARIGAPGTGGSGTARTAERSPPVATDGGINWWYVALGAVAVGTLAATAAGGDDGGSDGDASPVGDTVPLTITLGEPAR